jgi:transcriptional regulator CtsR
MALDRKICKAANIDEVEKFFVDCIDRIDDKLENEISVDIITALLEKKQIINRLRNCYLDMIKGK